MCKHFTNSHCRQASQRSCIDLPRYPLKEYLSRIRGEGIDWCWCHLAHGNQSSMALFPYQQMNVRWKVVDIKKARYKSGLILCLRGRRPGETINTFAVSDARSFSAMTENLSDTRWVAPSHAGAKCPVHRRSMNAGDWYPAWEVRGKQNYPTASLPDSCVLSFIALSNQCRWDYSNSPTQPCISISNKQAK